MVKKLLKIISISMAIYIVYELVYNNIISPNTSGRFMQNSGSIFPAFMFVSFLMMILKRKTEGEQRTKLSDEDRETFRNVGSGTEKK